MKEEIKLTLVFLLIVFFTITSAASGAELLKQQSTGNVVVKPAAITKLPNIIRINPNLLNAAGMNRALPDSFYAGWKKLTDNYNLMPSKITAYEQEAKIFQKKFEECSNKNYTQPDQQNAGCVDTDTLSTCSQKLFDNCIKAEDNNFENMRKDLANTVKNLWDAADQMYYYYKH